MIDLSYLNEEQRAPVLDTEGAVLVLAGAGSGKTRVLTTRIAYLIEDKGVPAENILAITFTNKAANEMRERLELSTNAMKSWVCTIHSMCVKILRMFGDRAGISPNFSIYSEAERNVVIKQAYKEQGFDEEDLLKKARAVISDAKMRGEGPEEYLKSHPYRGMDLVMKVYARYNEHLKKNNALDFDDLLIEARDLLRRDAETREYLAGRFRYIHVDEFQDTNAVQFEIIKMLTSVHGNLFVVGDDDQSIYGWRGAEIDNILHFERSFPKAKVYKLQRNYRSTKKILALANAAISSNEHRKGKELWTNAGEGDDPVYFEAPEESGEALYCARIIAEMRGQGYRYSDFAVLMRINALSRAYEQEFTKYGINYKVFGGFKFFERKEIKDILAYLRIASNPFDDEAVRRVVNVPRRGIGERTMDLLTEYAEKHDLSLFEAVLAAGEAGISSLAVSRVREFADFIRELVAKAQLQPVNELVRTLVVDSGMYAMYSDTSDESVTKRANIDEFQNSVDEYVRLNEGANLADYLQQITLYSDTDEMDEGDYVTVATIHAVKGLEFRCVFLVGLEDNIIPTPRSADVENGVEEERRLMYVAITRAKEKLWLTRSLSRYLYGRREMTGRSQFVDELKDVIRLPAKRDVSERQGYGEDGYGSYGGGYGFGSRYARQSTYASAPRRVGSAAKRESLPTFGAGRAPLPAKQPSLPQAPRQDTSRFKAGVRVRHARFGEGTVVSTRGSAGNLIVTVDFPSVGRKELAAALAPLDILE